MYVCACKVTSLPFSVYQMQALLFIYSSKARTLDNMSSFVAKDHRIGHVTLTKYFHFVLNEACMPLTTRGV